MRTWTPDIEIDISIAHQIVSRQFPCFAQLNPSFLGRGWDNFCIEYPGGTVFRLPTRKEGAQILANELAALPCLQAGLSIPVPNIQRVGSPHAEYPYPFIGYPLIPGRTSDQLTWTASARRAAASELATFLRVLHRFDCSTSPFRELPGDSTGKADPARLMRRIDLRAKELIQGGALDVQLFLRARNAAELLVEGTRTYQPCVVHGDLYPRHVLADDSLRITGVIDWGDVHVGDPAIDLSLAFSFFDSEERATFWHCYGHTPDADCQRVARLRATMYGFALAAYGLEEADAAAFEMGRIIIRRIDPETHRNCSYPD